MEKQAKAKETHRRSKINKCKRDGLGGRYLFMVRARDWPVWRVKVFLFFCKGLAGFEGK